MGAMQMGGDRQVSDTIHEDSESIKIERNSRGVNHSFRLKREPGENFDNWVARCYNLDRRLREKFGGED